MQVARSVYAMGAAQVMHGGMQPLTANEAAHKVTQPTWESLRPPDF